MTPAGLPHSDTPGSTLGCQLPRAYRRLLRPSSALGAKASTMRPSQLVTQKQQQKQATKNYKNARVHYPDLKIRTNHHNTHAPPETRKGHRPRRPTRNQPHPTRQPPTTTGGTRRGHIDPSGPNSVPNRPEPPPPRRSTPTPNAPTGAPTGIGSTDEAAKPEPANQSTFHQRAAPATEHPPAKPTTRSLERR